MGTEALLQSDNKRETSVLRWTSEGALQDPIYTDCVKRYTESYKHEMQHFTDILAGRYFESITLKDYYVYVLKKRYNISYIITMVTNQNRVTFFFFSS